MVPFVLTVSAAIIAICGVRASLIHKTTVYQWNGEQCIGHTKGVPFHLELDDCKEIDAMSLKFEPDPKDKFNHWINGVNQGRGQCYITAYPNGRCVEQGGVNVQHSWPAPMNIALPDNIGQCISVRGGIRSIRFWCVPKIGIGALTTTEGYAYTAWTIINGTATPILTSTSVVLTENYLTISPRDEAIAAPQAGHSIQPRVEPTVAPRGLIEQDYIAKNVWYMHPWARVPLCFECWITSKLHPNRFQCESSEDTRLSCPWPMPDGSTKTRAKILSQSTEMITPYVTKSSTATPAFNTSSVTTKSLEKRKHRLHVSLTNPFVLGSRTCAKAKWSQEGKRNQKIVLSGPRSCHNRFNDDIDPPASHTVWATYTVPPTLTNVVSPAAAPAKTPGSGTKSTITGTAIDTTFVHNNSTFGVPTTAHNFETLYRSTTIGGVVYRIWPTNLNGA